MKAATEGIPPWGRTGQPRSGRCWAMARGATSRSVFKRTVTMWEGGEGSCRAERELKTADNPGAVVRSSRLTWNPGFPGKGRGCPERRGAPGSGGGGDLVGDGEGGLCHNHAQDSGISPKVHFIRTSRRGPFTYLSGASSSTVISDSVLRAPG